MAGITALDFNVVISLLKPFGVKLNHQKSVLLDIKSLETGALRAINQRQKRKDG